MKNKLIIVAVSTLFLLMTPIWVSAQKPTEYELLTPIKELTQDPDTGAECVSETGEPCATARTFLPGLIRLTIMLATGIATISIIYGGIQYMSTDAFTGKESAKGIIENALWGLFLIMSAWIILNTINPKLVNFDLRIERQEIQENLNFPGGGNTNTGTGGLQQSTNNAVAGLIAACNCNVEITSTTGGSHDPDSLHYRGLAVDIGADTNLTKYLTGQTTNPRACATFSKTLNGVTTRFKWEPRGVTCGGDVPSSGDHWHMSVTQ